MSDPYALVAMLADDTRRRVFAALVLGASTVDEVKAATGPRHARRRVRAVAARGRRARAAWRRRDPRPPGRVLPPGGHRRRAAEGARSDGRRAGGRRQGPAHVLPRGPARAHPDAAGAEADRARPARPGVRGRYAVPRAAGQRRAAAVPRRHRGAASLPRRRGFPRPRRRPVLASWGNRRDDPRRHRAARRPGVAGGRRRRRRRRDRRHRRTPRCSCGRCPTTPARWPPRSTSIAASAGCSCRGRASSARSTSCAPTPTGRGPAPRASTPSRSPSWRSRCCSPGCAASAPTPRATTWERPIGDNLLGARVVVVGGGGITESLLRMLEPFGCDVTVVRRRPGDVPGATRVVGARRRSTPPSPAPTRSCSPWP